MDARIERIRTEINWKGLDYHDELVSAFASIEADLAELPLAKAQLEAVTKERDTKAAVIRDFIEDEDTARELLRPYLTNFKLEGDSYGVPGFVQWIETLIGKYNAVIHECDVARRTLDILDRLSYNECNCSFKRTALAMAEAEIAAREHATATVTAFNEACAATAEANQVFGEKEATR